MIAGFRFRSVQDGHWVIDSTWSKLAGPVGGFWGSPPEEHLLEALIAFDIFRLARQLEPFEASKVTVLEIQSEAM